MNQPLVSVVCLCYNHEKFINESIASVINQTYSKIQIIIADDASTDKSQTLISKLKEEHPTLEVMLLQDNIGNCAAFNKAYSLVRGDYVIDFATDDVMMPDRIEKQVAFFENSAPDIGVVFTDATYIDAHGMFIRNHFAHLLHHHLITTVPVGDIYSDILRRYFIPAPTMMSRRSVFDILGGYDETLSFEDFDFWVRSAAKFKYGFLNEKLTAVRKSVGSMSKGWYAHGDKQLMSTYKVCLKAQQLNRTEDHNAALITRAKYELRQSVLTGNHQEAALFLELLKDLKGATALDHITASIDKFRLPLRPVRALYHRIRFGKV